MEREEAIQWLKVINTKEFGWDDFALQESQREIRERCEQGVREAIDMAMEALSVANLKSEFESAEYEDYEHATLVDIKEPLKVLVVRCKDCRYQKINRKSGTKNCGHVYGMITADDDNFCSYGEKEDE